MLGKKPFNCYVPANQWREIEKDYNDPFHNCLPRVLSAFSRPRVESRECNFSSTYIFSAVFSKFSSGISMKYMKSSNPDGTSFEVISLTVSF